MKVHDRHFIAMKISDIQQEYCTLQYQMSGQEGYTAKVSVKCKEQGASLLAF